MEKIGWLKLKRPALNKPGVFYVQNLTSAKNRSKLATMTKKAPDFQIIPIFNQAAKAVWHDFLNIEIACDTKIYKLDPPCKTVIKTKLRGYKKSNTDYKHNFAFVAYTGQRAIGFAQGYAIDTHEAYLHHLYILPQYQKCGIGGALLHAVEQSCSVFANTISLVALENAVSFYEQKHDYSGIGIAREKELNIPANSVIPVFQWIKKDFCAKFAIPVETMSLKQSKFQPIFVHTNEYRQIDAITTRTMDSANKIWMSVNVRQPELDFCSCELLNALRKTR